MPDLFCRTCAHWDQRYQENPALGVCRKMGVILISGDAALNLADHWTVAEPTSDVAAMRTPATFGCVGHVARGTTLQTISVMGDRRHA